MALVFSKILPHETNDRWLFMGLELLFLTAGFIYSFIMLKGYSYEFIFTALVSLWNSIKCFLSSSLYICIIINFMILLIAVTSNTFQHHSLNDEDDQIEIVSVEEDDQDKQVRVSSLLPPLQSEDVFEIPSDDHDCVPKADEINTSIYFNSKNEETEEGEEDTIDATWNAINGREKESPVRKQLNKCETWNAAREVVNTTSEEILPTQSNTACSKELRKSETFNDSGSLTRGGRFMRRGPSMSLEEFNKQVEAFIKKFNDDIRLQRQESDQRFLDMIGRGL